MRASAWAPAALVYTILAAVLGRNVLANLGTTIANDPGDPLLTAAVLHWNATHLPWSDAWWQFPIYYPTRDTLAFSEHLLGLSVIATPLAWLTGNALAAYNLTVLLTFPLCALAMFALVFSLTKSAPAAVLAGLAYGFAPYRMSSLPHVQMLASFWAPLALLGLHAHLETGKRRWLALFGAAWALQAAANWYLLVLFSVVIALWVLWFVILRRRWRMLGAIAGVTLIAAVPLMPLVYRYLTVHARHGFVRGLFEMRQFSADVAAVLCAPPALTFWGWLRVACRSEGELFPGLALFALVVTAAAIALRAPRETTIAAWSDDRAARVVRAVTRGLLAVAGLYALIVTLVLLVGPLQIDAGIVRLSATDIDKPLLVVLAAAVGALLIALGWQGTRRPDSALVFYLFAAVVTWLLALGPTVTVMGVQSGRPGLFMLLQPLPGVSGLRVPARFWLMTVLCLATIAGLVLPHLLQRVRGRARIAAIVVLGLLLMSDSWSAAIPASPSPGPVPDAPALHNGVVLQLPIDQSSDIAATWRAATGGWRSVNGYSGWAPNYYGALTRAAATGDEAMLTSFRRDHELHVIVPDDAPVLKTLVERQPGVTVTARRAGATQYRLTQRATGTVVTTGTPLPIASARSDCAGDSVLLVLDRDESTKWDCLRSPESHWLTLDLGRAQAVGAVVYSLGPYGANVPSALAIETSADGGTWQPARSGSVLAELLDAGLADPKLLRAALPFVPREARYVRVRPVDQRPQFEWFVAEVGVLSPG